MSVIQRAIERSEKECPPRLKAVFAEFQRQHDGLGGGLAMRYLAVKEDAVRRCRLMPEDVPVMERVLGNWANEGVHSRSIVKLKIVELEKLQRADRDLGILTG